MKKKTFIAMLILCIVLTILPVSALAQDSPIKVIINGKTLTLETPPFIDKGRTLVPLRGIFEALQAAVEWDSFTQTVSSTRGTDSIRLQIGNQKAMKNGEQVTLEVPAKIVQNRTFVPIRYVSESFGADVSWDSKTKTITINATEVEAAKEKLTIQEIAKKSDAVVLLNIFDKSKTLVATGSGFIVSSSGKLVTNYHVIDQGYYVEAVTSNNKVYNVSGVISYDYERDIAVLQLENATSLPTVQLGDSSKVEVGDDTVAIGSPLALQNTVSNGIISSIRTLGDYQYLQTSTPISSGSSGGALFNNYGEVIGIIVAQYDGQNLNLAIPINDVLPHLKSTTKKTLLQVIQEVYPPLSYHNFSEHLYENYSVFPVGNFNLSFDDVLIVEHPDKSNELIIFLEMNKENYAIFEQAMKQGRYQEDIEHWMHLIGTEAQLRYPDKVIYGTLNLADEYAEYPSDFESEEITYNSETGKYEVFSSIVLFETEDDILGVYWVKTW